MTCHEIDTIVREIGIARDIVGWGYHRVGNHVSIYLPIVYRRALFHPVVLARFWAFVNSYSKSF